MFTCETPGTSQIDFNTIYTSLMNNKYIGNCRPCPYIITPTCLIESLSQ